MLEQDNTKKEQVDKNVTELDTGKNSGKYKIEATYNSGIYIKKLKSNQLQKLYLVFRKVI